MSFWVNSVCQWGRSFSLGPSLMDSKDCTNDQGLPSALPRFLARTMNENWLGSKFWWPVLKGHQKGHDPGKLWLKCQSLSTARQSQQSAMSGTVWVSLKATCVNKGHTKLLAFIRNKLTRTLAKGQWDIESGQFPTDLGFMSILANVFLPS